MDKIAKTVEQNEEGVRLDAFLAALSGLSRSRVLRLHEQGFVRLNGQNPAKLGVKLRVGDVVLMELPPPAPLETAATQMEIPIVYEDEDLIVINKPRGLVVHPSAGHEDDTLVNGLLFVVEGLSGIGGVQRPGIVHRLDKDTTGLLVVAKNDDAHLSLSAQIKDRSAGREYLALVEGRFSQDDGFVEAPIGRSKRDRKKMAIDPEGRWAKTNYEVKQRYLKTTLLHLKLETGRTHQIRVHMKSINHPVCGDPIYGLAKSAAGGCPLMLHATVLEFTHPRTGERRRFEVPLPEDFLQVLNRQRRDD